MYLLLFYFCFLFFFATVDAVTLASSVRAGSDGVGSALTTGMGVVKMEHNIPHK